MNNFKSEHHMLPHSERLPYRCHIPVSLLHNYFKTKDKYVFELHFLLNTTRYCSLYFLYNTRDIQQFEMVSQNIFVMCKKHIQEPQHNARTSNTR